MEEKAWYASKGVWGGLGAIIAGLLGAFTSYTVNPEAVAEVGLSLAGGVAGALALWGRIKATSVIK